MERHALSERKVMTNLDSVLKSRNINFAYKGPYSQSYGLSSSHVWMCELDYKEVWVPKNRCFWTVVLEKTLESPLDCSLQSILKEINTEYSFEALMLKLQYFGHLMWRANSLEKTLMLGKNEGRRRGWQDKMVGWHHQLNGHEFEQTLGDGEGKGGLVCCTPWGCKESDTTQQNSFSNSFPI